jgi:type IV pilus assembly protein PilB
VSSCATIKENKTMVKVIRKNTPSAPPANTGSDFLEKIDSSSRESETERRATELGIPYIDLSVFPMDGDHVRSLPEALARQNQATLFQKERGLWRVALTNVSPEIQEFFVSYAKELGQEVRFYLISQASLERALEEYEKKPFIEHLDQMKVTLSKEDLLTFEKDFDDLLSLKTNLQSLPTTKVLEVILAGANRLHTSDIHIEPEAGEVRLRYRIDGLLEDIAHIPLEVYHLTLSRIKMLAKMKLNAHTRSQDGSFFIMKDGERIDIRVSVIPSNQGETINMRLLNNAEADVPLETLGLRGGALLEIKRQIQKPHGMIVNTGPTGSGKTTTLYSLIREINDPSVKIITVEDPIEYTLPGVVQTAVDVESSYSFGQALRAIVRQDPDVILVGEIRDEETAEVAVNAALTGHLVFTTLHTNDAPASIVRLGELGVKGALIGSAVNVFIGQRLVRVLCRSCRIAYTPAPKTVQALEKILATIPKEAGVEIPKEITSLYTPGGCAECHFSGYRGREGVFEVFPVTDAIAKIIAEFATEQEIRDAAVAEGMMTMNQDGILKVVEGITTFQEVWRTTGRDEVLEDLYQDILRDPNIQSENEETKNLP